MNPTSKEQQLRAYYQVLFHAWGCQHWWPARTRFEVIVGAYLTQNTAWTNVERGLRRLRGAGLLSLDGIRRTPLTQLESLIRSTGYFRQKAQRLKAFVAFLDDRYKGSLNRMFSQPTEKLRSELLALSGVGPETADSILLYAGNHPVFVGDTYARRILDRHGILPANASYEEIRRLFERALAPLADNFTGQRVRDFVPHDFREHGFSRAAERHLAKRAFAPEGLIKAGKSSSQTAVMQTHSPSPISRAKRPELVQIYNDMHGLMVAVGKHYCFKSQPRCDQCPLQPFLPKAG